MKKQKRKPVRLENGAIVDFNSFSPVMEWSDGKWSPYEGVLLGTFFWEADLLPDDEIGQLHIDLWR